MKQYKGLLITIIAVCLVTMLQSCATARKAHGCGCGMAENMGQRL